MKNSLHYNLSHTQDCPTNFFRSWKSIFSQVFLKDHQVSFSRFLEHADQLLRETFEMFSHVVTTTVTTKLIYDVNFFLGRRNIYVNSISILNNSKRTEPKTWFTFSKFFLESHSEIFTIYGSFKYTKHF